MIMLSSHMILLCHTHTPLFSDRYNSPSSSGSGAGQGHGSGVGQGHVDPSEKLIQMDYLSCHKWVWLVPSPDPTILTALLEYVSL